MTADQAQQIISALQAIAISLSIIAACVFLIGWQIIFPKK